MQTSDVKTEVFTSGMEFMILYCFYDSGLRDDLFKSYQILNLKQTKSYFRVSLGDRFVFLIKISLGPLEIWEFSFPESALPKSSGTSLRLVCASAAHPLLIR